MTREDAKKMIPLLQGFIDGKIIQHYGCYNTWTDYEERDGSISFDPNWETERRIKPTPKLRPWKPEEVPVGAMTRAINRNADCNRWLINGATTHQIYVSSSCYTFEQMAKRNEYSIDDGKTWLPCGVLD